MKNLNDPQRERLINVMLKTGLKKAKFARKIGITPQRLNGILKGNHGVTYKVVKKVEENLGIPHDYILYGFDPTNKFFD